MCIHYQDMAMDSQLIWRYVIVKAVEKTSSAKRYAIVHYSYDNLLYCLNKQLTTYNEKFWVISLFSHSPSSSLLNIQFVLYGFLLLFRHLILDVVDRTELWLSAPDHEMENVQLVALKIDYSEVSYVWKCTQKFYHFISLLC